MKTENKIAIGLCLVLIIALTIRLFSATVKCDKTQKLTAQHAYYMGAIAVADALKDGTLEKYERDTTKKFSDHLDFRFNEYYKNKYED